MFALEHHYRGYPAVLARLSALRAPECRARLERAWRLKAPKTLVKQLDQPAPAKPRRQRP